MSYKIPLFELNYDSAEEEAVLATLRSKWISTGPKCEELERKFEEALAVKNAIALANCTSSLHLAYLLLGIGPGDEVICPSYTFSATVNAIKYVGATPVFCDIGGVDDLNISPKKLNELISSKTKAIVVVHFAGFPCDMERILKIASDNDLKVVEDACHGPLSEYKGQKLGTIGDIGCFSFFSNKNIATGEGGMLVTNDSQIAEGAKLLRSHGMTTMSYERSKGHATAYDILSLGYNYRLDDIHASLGIVQLEKLRDDLGKRAEVRKWYEERLKDVDKLIVPFKGNQEFVSNYIFPIVLQTGAGLGRNSVRNYLHEQGIQTSIHYPAVHKLSIYSEPGFTLSETDYVSENEISLPMHGGLKETEVSYICDCLAKAVNSEG